MPKRTRSKGERPANNVAYELMLLADIHGRLLTLIADPTIRMKWELELQAQTEMCYLASKEQD